MVRIHNKQLEKDISEGGLKLINISNFKKSLKLSWLMRLLISKGSWQNVFKNSNVLPPNMILELDQQCLSETVENCINPFWRDVLQIWNRFRSELQAILIIENTHSGEIFS